MNQMVARKAVLRRSTLPSKRQLAVAGEGGQGGIDVKTIKTHEIDEFMQLDKLVPAMGYMTLATNDRSSRLLIWSS